MTLDELIEDAAESVRCNWRGEDDAVDTIERLAGDIVDQLYDDGINDADWDNIVARIWSLI